MCKVTRFVGQVQVQVQDVKSYKVCGTGTGTTCVKFQGLWDRYRYKMCKVTRFVGQVQVQVQNV